MPARKEGNMVEILQFPKRAFGALIGVLLLATPQSAFATDLCAAGDMNGDSTVNVLDIVFLVQAIVAGGPGAPPEDFLTNCGYLVAEDGTKLGVVSDLNCDTATNVLDDVVLVLRILNNENVANIATDWDGDMYPAACDPCPGNEASPATELLCSFPNVTECAAAQADADGDGQVDQCQQGPDTHDILNVKLRPAVGTGQGVLYQIHAAIGWLGSDATESTNYRFTIEL